MQDYEAIAALRQAALLPDSVKLSDFYTEEQYRFIDNCLRVQVGMGLDKLCRMKPSYLTEMLRAELFKQWLGYDEQRSMETFFEAVAAERDIPVLGLDNIGETMYMLFDHEPFEWQCKELLKAAEYPENEVKQERTIKAMYLDGRLADIAFQVEGPDNTTTLSYSDYQVYCARNQQWVKRLRPHLADGACFITLNAIFLGGEQGLIQQLKAAGYRVRPVNRGITIKLKK
jgi:uncharacterized protein YbaP (TraB family)